MKKKKKKHSQSANLCKAASLNCFRSLRWEHYFTDRRNRAAVRIGST